MSKQSAKAKIGEWWLSRIGQVVSTQELYHASGGIQSHTRRVRELREEGWPIQSHLDASDITPGHYRLTGSPPQGPVPRFTRRVSKRLRVIVLERNNSVCKLCGATPDGLDDKGRPITMHVDHIDPKSGGGEATLENLRTLCRNCNEGAKHLLSKPPESLLWLKGKVRATSASTQRAIYAFLKEKFEGTDDGES